MAPPKAPPKPRPDVVEAERSQFRLLLAKNPNYFGTIADSPLKAVAKIASNTSYEQLTCVGYNLDQSKLEATVQIKKPAGYGGDLCKDGTIEYVRFFLDYGAGWEDQGVMGIKVHDIPNSNDCHKDSTKPLSYVASLKISPKKKICKIPVLPRVRAILSWQAIPPAGNPNYTPVWGNVLERHIQIRKLEKNFAAAVDEIATAAGLTLEIPLVYAELAEIPIPLPDPGDPPIAVLAQLYGYGDKDAKPAGPAASKVETHRFGMADIHAVSHSVAAHHDFMVAKAAEWKLAGLDFAAAIAALEKVSANTSYEELECLGLDNNTEYLAATFRIKRPAGYSGGPCTKGGYEYVSFWADWDDTCTFTYLGTVKVNVHDFSTIPADGLCYTALLKVNLDEHRAPCEKPKIGRVRAVLSWTSPPSTTDPDDLKYWGNRIDTHVQINPNGSGTSVVAQLRSIGGIAVPHIDAVTGLTDATAVFHFNWVPPDPAGRSCPFAGIVVITGPTVLGMRYGITVENLTTPSAPLPLVNSFKVLDSSGTVETTQAPSASALHTYQYLDTWFNPELILGRWFSSGDDKWRIRLQLYDAAESPVGAPISHMIQLKNSGVADARLHIDPLSGGDCHKFFVGDPIDGHFVAVDSYLSGWSLSVAPFPTPPGVLTPMSGSISTPPAPPGPTSPPPGGSPWHLDTTGMKPCGYIVALSVSDRAIINSASVGHSAWTSVGWCLDPAPEK
jgi:hypothetical protein